MVDMESVDTEMGAAMVEVVAVTAVTAGAAPGQVMAAVGKAASAGIAAVALAAGLAAGGQAAMGRRWEETVADGVVEVVTSS